MKISQSLLYRFPKPTDPFDLAVSIVQSQTYFCIKINSRWHYFQFSDKSEYKNGLLAQSLITHTHSATEGGQLDWDVIWSDAVHSHESAGEGDTLDHGLALTGLTDDDHTQYILHSLADAANDFLIASGADTFIKKTLAETGAILEGDIEHGNIQGLADDDHTQYILVDATRDFYNNTQNCEVVVESDLWSSGLVLDSGSGVGDVAYLDFKHSGSLKGNIGCFVSTSGQPLELNSVATTDISMVTGGGKVGINTSSPTTMLHVYDNSVDNTVVTVESDTHSAGIVLDNADALSVSYVDFYQAGVLKGNIKVSGPTAGTPLELNPDSSNNVNIGGGGGTMVVMNGVRHNTTRVTSGPYNILATDHILFFDTDGGAFTANLPAGVEGTNYKLINCGSSGNNLTVDPNGTEQLWGGGAGVGMALVDGDILNIHYNATEGWW